MDRIILILIFFSLTIISCGREEKSLNTLNSHFFTNEQYKFTLVDKGIKMAYLDIGSIDSPIVLLLHGEPNSSFVYRNIAPYLVKQNFRVIIPDLVGFGYSDKPLKMDIITYFNQTKWMNNFIDNLKLTDINLFAHSIGGE